jgi:isopenicillin N synthase-like dioxygenase
MTIPLIDLSAAPPAALARAIDAALGRAGFFTIVGHGVPRATIDAAFAASRRFFALPEARKAASHIELSGHKRGWDPVGWQALDPLQPPDLKESFYLGVEAFAPNPWPDDAMLPGFRSACEAYTAAMDALARRLMRLFELALDLAPGHFDAYMRQPICTTRLLHYPPLPASLPGQIGCGAHSDWGALTLLAQDDAGGLQVEQADGTWLDATPVEGSFVVNVGDMMQRWTNDRWRSTVHRVANRVADRERWSIAYFFDLDGDALIEPLASCVGAANPPRYAPITSAAHLEAMYRRTTVAA